MIPVQEHIAAQFLHKTFRFVCDCLIPIDVTGTVVDWSQVGQEIVLSVSVGSKIIKIGLNHPDLMVELM